MTAEFQPLAGAPGEVSPIDQLHSPDYVLVRRNSIPEVHNTAWPHVHASDGQQEYSIQAMPGDTPRSLMNMGLVYLSLGMALESSGVGLDTPWEPEARPES